MLPLLHGTHGEDGTVQGMLELAGVPFVGSGVLGSALCMDKLKAKDVLAAHGLPQVPWIGLRDTELDERRPAASPRPGLRYPLFVKPANLGSSVGVSRGGRRRPTLADAVALAAQPTTSGSWSRRASHGREIEVAVLGNADAPGVGARARSSPATTSTTTRTSTSTAPPSCVIPADLPDGGRRGDPAASPSRPSPSLRCDGMARVDFFYEEDGRGLLLNELNTIPGFTPISMYPKLWEASGLPYDRAHRRARAPGPRAPRAPQPLLHQALRRAPRRAAAPPRA